MSNQMVYLWDAARFGVPEDFSATLPFVRDLEERMGMPSEAMLSFADDLTAYLKKCGRKSWVETLGNLPGKFRAKREVVLVVHLPSEDSLHILAKMVELGQRHNIGIYYDGAATAFLPDGRVYPEGTDAQWKKEFKRAVTPEAGFPKTKKQFLKYFCGFFKEMLLSHGDYVESIEREPYYGYKYSRQGQDITQEIIVYCQPYDGGFVINVGFRFLSPAVSKLIKKYDFKCKEIIIDGEFVHLSRDAHGLMARRQIDVSKVIYAYQAIIFPLFDRLLSILDVDAVFNGNDNSTIEKYVMHTIFKPQLLVVAVLAGNKNYEDLVRKYSGKNGGYIMGFGSEAGEDEWPKLLNDLSAMVESSKNINLLDSKIQPT